MMKTPEEIKKGLECGACGTCPYFVDNSADGKSHCKEVEYDAIAYIQQLEEACQNFVNVIHELAEQIPKWISVEERLPENQDNVLILYGNGGVAIAYYDEDDEFFWRSLGDGAYRGVSATHWMPLLEPPKEDTK